MATGDKLTQGHELGNIMSRLYYFLLMFTPKQLSETVQLTDENL